MNQFIKTFLACLLAFVVANILIGVFFVMVLAGIGSLFSEKAVSVEPGSVLRIDLSERIVDSPPRIRSRLWEWRSCCRWKFRAAWR